MTSFIRLNPVNRRLLCLSIFLALAFWLCAAFPPFSGRFILKASPILALALIVWSHRQSGQHTLLFVAVIFHSLGDALLDIDRAGLFLPALVTFLLGHVFYILTFKADIPSTLSLSTSQKVFAGGITLFAIFIGFVTVPHLEAPLVAPVVLYMIVISTMVICTFLANYRTAWISAGALSYLLSDSLIAISTFVHPFAGSAAFIWPMYYGGQFLIVIGFLQEKAQV